MLQTVRAEKVDEKMGPFVQIPCFLAKLWSIYYPKNVHFLRFCAVLSKKPESVKTTVNVRLKVLITLFQQMIRFIGV